MPSARILVVDDEEMNLDLSSRRLERSGFQVGCARSGRAALDELEKHDYDLVLLDQMMPEMSGVEVVRRLRNGAAAGEHNGPAGQVLAGHPRKDIPIIMVTAVTDSARIAEALDWGADDYITKPVDYAVALARIRAQLTRKRAASELRRSHERYSLAASGAREGLWEWDFRTGRVYYSAEWKRLLGFTEDRIGSMPGEWLDRIHPQDRAAFDGLLERHRQGLSPALESEQRVRAQDGSYRWMLVRAMCQRDLHGTALRLAGTMRDRPAPSTQDAVTGLANRRAFLDGLEQAVASEETAPASMVLLLGLDRFQQVNDSLGPPAGDQLLLAVAGRLQEAVLGPDPLAQRPSALPRTHLVARLEGDMFAILAGTPRGPVADREAAAAEYAGRILQALRPAVPIDGRDVFCTASIGIVLVPLPEQLPLPSPAAADIMRDAATAMHAAKARGRGRWVFFHEKLRDLPRRKLQLESELRRALERNEFEVYYQPRIRLTDGAVCGFEALARWNHPERGLVLPGEFIPLAEETGLILEIGRVVLWEACRQTRAWQQQFAREPRLDIAVNLSVCQCREPGIVAQVARVLEETGLPPECLHLELTESMLLDNLAEARATLTALKAMGVGLKVDDFGTGYSSLSYLSELPFDSLKIDRCFTMALDRANDKANPASTEMVKTILAMAHSLHLGVVAEGVERLEHLSELLRLGCEFGQGYYFSKPVPAGVIEQLLRYFPALPLPALAQSLAGWDAWNHRSPSAVPFLVSHSALPAEA